MFPVPWQQFVDPVDRMLCDARKDIGQPGLRIDIVKTGGLDQRVKHGGALSTAIGAAEQPCLAPKGHRPFILPMSAKSGKFTIFGIPILGGKSAFGG